jgi:hypothetical protein
MGANTFLVARRLIGTGQAGVVGFPQTARNVGKMIWKGLLQPFAMGFDRNPAPVLPRKGTDIFPIANTQ